jgi:hypothetical protein
VDYRSTPAVETDVGPVISVEDAVGSKETAGLKDRMGAWANQIRAREANPDIDKSVGLLNSGQAMPGESQAAGASGAAGRRSSLSQERVKGERGS